MPVEMVCNAFDISRSSYYEYRHRRNHVDVERMALRAQVNRLFTKSRSSAGSRIIKGLLSEEGAVVGRFKVRRLMSELGLICKQPGPHAYKQATVERPDIPNHLDREFAVERPDQVWCGDITYSVPGVQGEHGSSNEPRVYLEYCPDNSGGNNGSIPPTVKVVSLSGSDLRYARRVM